MRAPIALILIISLAGVRLAHNSVRGKWWFGSPGPKELKSAALTPAGAPPLRMFRSVPQMILRRFRSYSVTGRAPYLLVLTLGSAKRRAARARREAPRRARISNVELRRFAGVFILTVPKRAPKPATTRSGAIAEAASRTDRIATEIENGHC